MTQHSSPLSSPGPLISHSPGSMSVTNIIQSPTSNMSPRIGTPHSQGDSSPGPVQSPSQVCPPPPMPRMTSPQHRRMVTSPVGYSADMRSASAQGMNQIRFARPPHEQRVRLPSPVPNFQQKPNTPSPLSSPPPQHANVTQQLLQKHIQQSLAQQGVDSGQQNEATLANSQRAVQLIQQRQLILRQQQLAQQHQMNSQQQALTPQQHHLLLQQQLVKQQQLAHLQAQGRLNQQQNNPTSSSPLPPKSPLLSQVQNIMSPHSIHSQPPSPMPPRSPMVSFNNNPTSPMPRSPAVQQSNLNQPPSSPMMHSQPPSSPIARSPMLVNIQSPMRRPVSSPAMPDRPMSVENPGTPRSSYNTQCTADMQMSDSDMCGGGGNPHNPTNPIPIMPGFGRFGYFKLGLRGGSPMWNFGRGAKRIPTQPEAKEEDKNEGCSSQPQPKPKKESHLSKVSILKKKSPIKTNLQSFAVSKVGSLVSTDYNEFDDSSCTPPVTPPPIASTSKASHIQKGKSVEQIEAKEIHQSSTSAHSKQLHEEMMDYDDDNDNTVVSTEVSLSAAAQQNDGDDITVIETFSSDLTDVMSSPLESEQITDEFVLFPGNMVVDISGEAQYSDKDEEDEEYTSQLVNIHDKNMHIVNVAIQSPTTSEEELIMQGNTKKVTSDGLTLNIVQGLSSNHLLSMTDTPESPEQEEIQIQPSPESLEEELLTNFDESEIVIIDPMVKSPEEQISTKEDFEELIDEGTKKEKIIRSDALSTTHINEMHKYTATNLYSFQPRMPTTTHLQHAGTSQVKTAANQKQATNVAPQQISLIASPIKNVTAPKNVVTKPADVISVSRGAKIISTSMTTSLASLILPIKTTVRSNMISVPKLVTSVSPAITIVSASSSQIASILPSRFTVPVISASAVSKLPNVKVIDKPSSSLSLTTHDACLPKKIFEDEPVSPDTSNCEDEKNTKDKGKTEALSDKKEKQLSEGIIKPSHDVVIQKVTVVKDIPESPKEFPKKLVEERKQTVPMTSATEVVKSIENPSASKALEHTPVSNPSKPGSVLIHSTPELKMTAQIIQESQTGVHIASRSDVTIPASFITTQALEGIDNSSSDLDNKSVVISIPSPTPSQEQMLDNIALQALENRRRDGNGISGEFESFEDVLDMIENITGEPPTVLEDNIKDKLKQEEPVSQKCKENLEKKVANETKTASTETKTTPVTSSVLPTTSGASQLSPLSQPTELTTNMANVSQQLRTLLSTTSATFTSSETPLKNVSHKEKVLTYTSPAMMTPKTVQQAERISPITTTANTVIVPNYKSKPVVVVPTSPQKPVTTMFSTNSNTVTSNVSISSSPAVSISVSYNNPTSVANLLSSRSMSGIQLMPDHPKLPPVTSAMSSFQISSSQSVAQSSYVSAKMSVISSSINTTPSSTSANTVNTKSLSLNAMLQSHPAATVPQTSPSTITTASILGPPLGIIRSGFGASLMQAHSQQLTATTTNPSHSVQSASFNVSTPITTSPARPLLSTTNLLHTQLTKSVKPSVGDEQCSAFESLKRDEIKTEIAENIPSSTVSSSQSNGNGISLSRVDLMGGCKLSTIHISTANRIEDSQNVLLKQLLQNTACASTATASVSGTTSTTSSAPSATPSLPVVPNLEAQLARPVPPTPTSLLPPILQNDSPTSMVSKVTQRTTVMSRETSFVSKPLIQQSPPTVSVASTQQLHIDTKKCLPPSRTPSRDELLSPPTPRSTCSQDSSLQTPPLLVKKEIQSGPMQQTSMLLSQEVKKELVDESSQHSEVSDHSRSDIQMKEELMDLDSSEKMALDAKEELKKLKRRAYQQKRRQNQILGKEAAGQPKKRPRKSSKVEEDYDSYIDNLLVQLRSLPPMIVAEPVLSRNFSVVPIFGSGDLSKVGNKDYDSRIGDLVGVYGNAILPDTSDYYSTKPYGDCDSLPEKSPASTQRGFYDQEFPLIKLDSDEDKKFDLFCRDDTPDSIISSSSPECVSFDPPAKFPGLRLISDDEDEEDSYSKMRMSPIVPIIAPIPIRLKATGPYLKDYTETVS